MITLFGSSKMRNKFGKFIYQEIQENPKTILLVGDIGFRIFDDIFKDFPNNIVNCGIAEQNMIGTAAGLAKKGFNVYVYTIIPFLLLRGFEFIKNLIGHQKLKVTLVGVGGGLAYDSLGFTHYSREDLIIANTVPNLTTHIPYDPRSMLEILKKNKKNAQAAYVRLNKGGEAILKPLQKYMDFDIILDYGNDFSLISYGGIAEHLINIVDQLAKNKIKGNLIFIKNNKAKINYNKILRKKIIIVEEQINPGVIMNSVINYIDQDYKVQLICLEKNFEYKFKNKTELLNAHGINYRNIRKLITS
jgi:transketolase